MHGAGSTWFEQVFLSDFNLLADQHGFIAVYPQGYGNTWNSGPRCCSPANRDGIDDVGFLTAVIDEVAARLGRDEDVSGEEYADVAEHGEAEDYDEAELDAIMEEYDDC